MKGNRGYGRVRRGISVLLALVMVMSLISIQAFANVPITYYICGTMTNWDIDEAFELTLGDDDLYYIGDLELTTDSEFVVVDDDWNYYPDGAGGEYGANGEITANGTYSVTFDPNRNGDEDEGWFEGYFLVTPINVEEPAVPTASYHIYFADDDYESYPLTYDETDGYYHYDGLALTAAVGDTPASSFIIVDNEYNYYPPDAMYGGEYGEDGEIKANGTYNVTFDPEGGHDGWFGGYFLVELAEPTFFGHRMVLGEEIGLQFRLILPEGFPAAEDATVEFEVSDGRTESVALSSVEPDEKGDLWFTCHINALELADEITATFAYGDGKAATNLYSAVQYFKVAKETYSGDQYLCKLIDALQDLGYFMQGSGWMDSDGEGGYREGHIEIELSSDHADFDVYGMIARAYEYEGQISELNLNFEELEELEITDVKFSMTLNAATMINLLVDGDVTSEHEEEMITINGKHYYWIQSDEIKASALLEEYDFHVETSNGEIEIWISPMQYMFIMLGSESVTEKQQAALAAFVCYAFAANDYALYGNS